METELSYLDKIIIKRNLTSLTDDELADLITKPVEMVRTFINIITGDGTIKQSRSQKLEAKEIRRKKKNVERQQRFRNKAKKEKPVTLKTKRQETIKLIADQNRQRIERNALRNQPLFKTRQVDFSQLQTVRIDRKTVIFIKPGQDPELAKSNYLKKLNK
jgi:hypothetical protein